MAEIVDISQDPLLSLNMICSLGTQQERQIVGDQFKGMIDTSRSSYERRYASKVCNHCGKTRYMIDTWYRKHDFPPRFKFKNKKEADCNNNQ